MAACYTMPCRPPNPICLCTRRTAVEACLLARGCTRFMINNEGRSPSDSTLSLFLSSVMGPEYVPDEEASRQ
ncbi:hypothetical protein CEP54_004869 [Fusarium duplospermum]|uniref:Uncharacterized protein n=1 Tax=Fusarium duplospermum TaxID=1325734 RepID=A0A428QFD1_9HYPO|nr:hypothetical protein CEP54_004869 [Fusarium duplospermum]